jgi:hypothetical protein
MTHLLQGAGLFQNTHMAAVVGKETGGRNHQHAKPPLFALYGIAADRPAIRYRFRRHRPGPLPFAKHIKSLL